MWSVCAFYASIKANTDEFRVNYEHLHMSAAERTSRVLANYTTHVYLWCMYADLLLLLFCVSVGRVFCVQTFAAHFINIYARFHLPGFISFHFVFMCTLSHLFEFGRCSFWLLESTNGYKWTSNADIHRNFIFECSPKHVNQHLHSDTKKELNGAERDKNKRACVWQRWKCAAE